MKYCEIFHSVQGEGARSGRVSTFFRFNYCNLRCSWCDTPYSSHRPDGSDITMDHAMEEIMSHNCKEIVITGGEPFIWPTDLTDLCSQLKGHGCHITIETNGTIWHDVNHDLTSLSPKTRNSNPVGTMWEDRHDKLRLNYKSLAKFMDKSPDYQFKFVVDGEEDLPEIEEILRDLDVPNDKVWLMPQGITRDEVLDRQESIVELCMKTGYQYSDRLHTRLWSDAMGK